MNKVKVLIITIISLFIFMPMMVFADTQAQDLLETLETAGIEVSVDDYEENDNQVEIYLFWSTGCSHCHEELEFYNSILGDYKDKIKMRSYESSNPDNYALQKKMMTFFNLKESGVPFAVIGENTFYGFRSAEETGEKIKDAIDEEYAKSLEERYDVWEEMEKNKQAPKNQTALYVFGGLLAVVMVGVIIYIVTKKD